MSGATRDRPELARLLDQLRPEDVMVVTRFDRLATPPATYSTSLKR